MIAIRSKNSVLTLACSIPLIMAIAGVRTAQAAYEGPIKAIPRFSIGWEVNKTGGKTCLFETETCGVGKLSAEPGGFTFAKNIAVNDDKGSSHYGHLYVIDGTHRVQELNAAGGFVSTFGWDVNKTKVAAGGLTTQAEKNICTEIEIKAGGECQSGVEGEQTGQFGETQGSIAIDPSSGDVYVTDDVKIKSEGKTTNGVRVQKFTADGIWVWEVGKEVNATKDSIPGAGAEEKNLCTENEVEMEDVKCVGPKQYEFGAEPVSNATEPGVFAIEGSTVLAFGGREDILYIGAGLRIEEIASNGSYHSEIPLTGAVSDIALDDSCDIGETILTETTSPTCASFDPSYGDLYVAYRRSFTATTGIVDKLDASGALVAEMTLEPRREDSEAFFVDALAVDSSGRLAVSEAEQTKADGVIVFGGLLDGATGRKITEFSVSNGEPLRGLAFNPTDELYGVARHEVVSYSPVHVAELVVGQSHCQPGTEIDTSVTFDCSVEGEVNPEEVPDTEVWLEWGFSKGLGEVVPDQPIVIPTGSELVPVPPLPASPGLGVGMLQPNRTVYYRFAAHDENVRTPELLSSDIASFTTPMVAPRTAGKSHTAFVGPSSAVLSGELNPENAPTNYFFEYGTALAGYCSGDPLRTKTLDAAVYGRIGATLEVAGLQPATTYQYRLCATNNAGDARDEHGGSDIEIGEFTTAGVPLPEAMTGPYSALGSTYATISGRVDARGQPAIYIFEIGSYAGAHTQYNPVFSGAVDKSTSPVDETAQLTGLLPGITYAYRIKVTDGYGEATGAEKILTTLDQQSCATNICPPASLVQLAVPMIAFPAVSASPSPFQQLTRSLKACRKKHKKQRTICERRARKKYSKARAK